jgi:hypothetical protein
MVISLELLYVLLGIVELLSTEYTSLSSINYGPSSRYRDNTSMKQYLKTQEQLHPKREKLYT